MFSSGYREYHHAGSLLKEQQILYSSLSLSNPTPDYIKLYGAFMKHGATREIIPITDFADVVDPLIHSVFPDVTVRFTKYFFHLDPSPTEPAFSIINEVFHNSAVFREKIGYSKVIMLQEEYDVFNDINHNLEPDFNSMYLYYLGMIDPTLPSPDTELEEFTVTPNEAVLQELETDHEPLDNSFEIICVRTSNHVEPDEEC